MDQILLDILRKEDISIEERRVGIYKYADVDLSTIKGDFKDGNYRTVNDQYNEEASDAFYNIYKGEELILCEVSDARVLDFINDLKERYGEE